MANLESESLEANISISNGKQANETPKRGIKVRILNQALKGTEKLDSAFTYLGFINNVVPFRNAYIHFGNTIKLSAKEHLLGDDVKNASEFIIAEHPATGVKEISTNKLSLSKFAPVIFAKTGMLGLIIGAIVLLRGMSETNTNLSELTSVAAFVTSSIIIAGVIWSFISTSKMKLKQVNIKLYNGEIIQLYAEDKQVSEINSEFKKLYAHFKCKKDMCHDDTASLNIAMPAPFGESKPSRACWENESSSQECKLNNTDVKLTCGPAAAKKYREKTVMFIIRKGPYPQNPEWYTRQVLSNYGINMGIECLYCDSFAEIENQHLLASVLVQIADKKGVMVDSSSIISHIYHDADGYQGVLVTAHVLNYTANANINENADGLLQLESEKPCNSFETSKPFYLIFFGLFSIYLISVIVVFSMTKVSISYYFLSFPLAFILIMVVAGKIANKKALKNIENSLNDDYIIK